MRFRLPWQALLLLLLALSALGTPPARADEWGVGNIVGLCRGTEIREGPGFGYRVHTIVPEDNWAVKIIDGPRYVDGEEWWDTSRRAAGDPSGGTGWVYRRQAESCRAPAPTPPPPATTPAPAQVVLVVGLSITPPFPEPGQWVNARFTVRNVGGQTFAPRYFGVKGRGPGDSNYDFLWMENFTLGPGQEFTYDANRPLGPPGQYCFTPQYSPDGQTWTDIRWPNGSSNTLCALVEAPPTPTPPPTLPPSPTPTPVSPTPPPPSGRVLCGQLVTDYYDSGMTSTMYGVLVTCGSGDRLLVQTTGFGSGGEYYRCEEPTVVPLDSPFPLRGGTVYYSLRACGRVQPIGNCGECEAPPTFTPTPTSTPTRAPTVPPTRTPTPTRIPTVTPTPRPAAPARVVLTGDLVVSPSRIQPGQSVNARFTIRNIGGQTFQARYLGVAGRGPGGLNADFQWLENFALRPGESFTYDVNRTLDRAGRYEFVPQYSPDGQTWVDLTGEDGRTSRATVEVAAPGPPQPPPPSTSICAYTQTNCYPYGECTWYAWERRKDLPCFLGSAGHAANWADSAQRCGFQVDSNPSPGAVAVFPPGVLGAHPTYGHVAVVERVYASGWYRVSEYNFGCYHCAGTRDVQPDGRVRFIHGRAGAQAVQARVLAARTGTLAEGQQQRTTWTVPSGQAEAGFLLTWPGSALDLVVTDPQGRRVDETYPGAWIEVTDQTVYVSISDPVPGEWTVVVVGREVPEGSLPYTLVSVARPAKGAASGGTVRPLWGLLMALLLTPLALGAGVGGILWARQKRKAALKDGLGPSPGLVHPPRPVPGGWVAPPRPGASPPNPPAPPLPQSGAASAGGGFLQVQHGLAAPLIIPLPTRPVVIGRDPRCDVVLADPMVSARHAQIAPSPSGYWLTDLGSTNGTFVNGQRVQQVLLRPGDQIRVGATWVRLGAPEISGQVAHAPTPPAPSAAPGGAWLEVGGQRHFVSATGGEVGRDPRCSVVLNDPTVSARHARLEYRDGAWWLTDLGSTNGTFVNGQRVQRHMLQRGDTIHFGRASGRFWV